MDQNAIPSPEDLATVLHEVVREKDGTAPLDQDSLPSPEDVATVLHEVVREKDGTEPRRLAQHPTLRRLLSVQTSVETDYDLEAGDSLRRVLQAACSRLEPDARAKAAASLFGLLPTARHTFLRTRQEQAGTFLGAGWDRFRKNYQDAVIQDVADELWRLDRRILHLQKKDGRAVLLGYRTITKEYTYIVSEEDQRAHTYRREIEIEAVRPGVTMVEQWYQWSGEGEEGTPIPVSSGHRLLTDPAKSSNWKYYYIHLGRELPVGARERIIIEQELYDTHYEFEPYLNATIDNASIEKITLRAKLPKQRPPAWVEHLVWSSYSPTAEVVEKNIGHYDKQDGIIQWSPADVQVGFRYEIRWRYSDGSGIYPNEIDGDQHG